MSRILKAIQKILTAILLFFNAPISIIITRRPNVGNINTSQRITLHGDPTNAKNNTVNGVPGVMDWAVSPAGVVSLFPSDAGAGSRDCVVTGIAPGSAVVTAKLTLPDGTTVITGSDTINVVADPADSIPTHINITEGPVEQQ